MTSSGSRDPESLVILPDCINGVIMDFAPGVDRLVRASLIDLLAATIHSEIALPYRLDRLWISSASDRHHLPSRHAMRRAVDISRINGRRMSVYYGHDAEATVLTDVLIRQLQVSGPTFVAREIFGPGPTAGGVKLKLGMPWPGVKDHSDHIHLSEGDRAAIIGCPWQRA